MGWINQGRYDRLLRRTTAQVGPGSKVGNALEDLFPVLEVENAPVELLRASGWILGMGRIDTTAAVGTTNSQQLFNPVDSSKLIVLTSLTISTLANTNVVFGPGFIALADSSLPGAERDTRDGVISSTVGLLQQEDDGPSSAFGNIRIIASTTYQMIDPNGIAVLAPGTGFLVSLATVTLRLTTSWMWRERVAEPEELAF